MFELVVGEHFDAAHFLRGYTGKCAKVHGHTWQVEIRVRGERLDESGMLVDFSILKKKLREITGVLDHSLINDLDYFTTINPTAENISIYIAQRFQEMMKDVSVKICSVTVWESPRAAAIYYLDR
ncbi:MAG: 6-carboxytetrahydropterin synthase QueD [Desulfitobacteriaceae bacterium]|nr:6-carboxytetrahydropterin synthase QueD [Desulfitobacteriaceae bacterium]MDD4752194.1 6-carboxytetrahydropterin synthase QueD [Desulfitobacteriaceae bacterium]